MKKIVSLIKKNQIGNVKTEVNLSNYTTYKVGGTARIMVYPKSVEKLIELIKILRENNIKYLVLGLGSNVIFSDYSYDGVIIKLDEFNKIIISDTVITAQAGVPLIKLSNLACKHGLTGLEFASGIPGSLGGAIYMNAGAYKSDMGYITSSIKVLTPDLQVKTLYNKDLEYKYRDSFLRQNKDYICIEATLILMHGDKREIKKLIETRRHKRLMTQPLNFPSAGSVFRNPDNDFAGRLIEECNLKGFSIGGAKVSEKHANFIVNYNNASASNIKNLIDYVHDKVKEKKNVDLKIEQEFINWE